MSTQCREEIDINKQTMCCGHNITAIGYTTIIEGRRYEHTRGPPMQTMGAFGSFLRGGNINQIDLYTRTLFPILITTNTPATNTCAG